MTDAAGARAGSTVDGRQPRASRRASRPNAWCWSTCFARSAPTSRCSSSIRCTISPRPTSIAIELAERWGLNLVTLRAPAPSPGLWRTDTHECCAVHKVGPLFAALEATTSGSPAFAASSRRAGPTSRSRTVHAGLGRASCGRSARSPRGPPRTSGTTRRRTTFRCSRSTTVATRASAASRARPCRWIRQTRARGAGGTEAGMRHPHPAGLTSLGGSVESRSVVRRRHVSDDERP